jgi:hypothetical protein
MRWPIRRTADRASGGGAAPAGGTDSADRLLPTSRLEVFSDGVFAIAITLLVFHRRAAPAHTNPRENILQPG